MQKMLEKRGFKQTIRKMKNNKFISQKLKCLLTTVPAIQKIHVYNEIISLTVSADQIKNAFLILKHQSHFQFKLLSCVSGLDCPDNKYRFKVIYDLLSIRYNNRIRVQTFTNETSPLPSIDSIYPAAGWYESEIWDMFGVFFQNHSNLTRLLTDYGFEGYPLRKDFPLSGFIETNYNYTKKQVLNNKIELSQEFKTFTFSSPWDDIEIKH